jgi:hypothetical protein
MDRAELYVLETAGKKWAWKKSDAANISNRLSIGSEADAVSDPAIRDFCKQFTEPVYTTFSGSKNRSAQMRRCLATASTAEGCMAALRSHDTGVTNPFARGSVSSACMHYGGMVGDHTTASMVVSLEERRMVVWSTGCSTPCVSLFKPWLFGTEAVLPIAEGRAEEAYWLAAEKFRRNLLGKKLPDDFYTQRDEIQNRWIAQAENLSDEAFPAFSKACLEEENAFYEKWASIPLADAHCAPGFAKRWEKKNNRLDE